ncbi:MAG: DUF1360 domain-containing protein [Candidatus Promineifilaceae bacterium]|nr:DUF1360 domain-containing protein [Candidatus Promineifilaceae bacterium]
MGEQQDRPFEGYAVVIATYLSLLAALASLIHRRKLLDETPEGRELALLGVATYRFSRLVTYDRVTQVLRLPFIERGEGYRQIEGTQEQPAGHGLRRSLGQLLNCSWCTSIWAGTFNVAIFTLFPRIGRFWNMVMMASGISELLDPLFPLFNYLAGTVQKKEQLIKAELEVEKAADN